MKSSIRRASRGAAVAGCVLCLLAPVSRQALAGDVYAYPLNGQSGQQQQKDDADCNSWATERTGFDPRFPPQYVGGYSSPPPPSSSGFFGRGNYDEGGGLLDAGKGAGLGALGGAIAGNAGAGAAIGALSGLFIGAIKRSEQSTERQAWENQQAQQQAQQRAQYQNHVAQLQADHDRAYSACMSGRGYRVN